MIRYKKEDYTNKNGEFTYFQGINTHSVTELKIRELEKRIQELEKPVVKHVCKNKLKSSMETKGVSEYVDM